MPLLLGVDELCRLLRIGRTTVFEEIKAGELRPVRIHRRTLFDWADVIAYIEHKKRTDPRRRPSVAWRTLEGEQRSPAGGHQR